MRSIIITLIAMLTLSQRAGAENTATGIFHPDFRTLTIALEGNRLAPPIITLGSSDRITIGFDRIGEERDYLRYSIFHCDAGWNPSGMVDSEVFSGFNYADVEDYAFSRGTTTHYVHYTITLPNNGFQFSISGNYLLKVYPENDPDDTLLQVRFMVSEGMANITGNVTSRTDIDYNDKHQQLELEVDLNRYPVRDIFNDLRVTVAQNGRLDNQSVLTHPSRVNGTKAIYEHQRGLIFPAGNEYRRMETVQLTYPGMGVESIDFHHPYYHHLLGVDTPRHSSNYNFDSTQHGRFFIREYNSDESDTEADYSVVHFTLDLLPVPGKEIYLDGDFTNRRFDESSRMPYDPESGLYRKAMLLKQGAYNYQYLSLPSDAATTKRNGSNAYFNNNVNLPASTDDVEGNFYQTVNEYLVAVYYSAPGERYDRLLGYTLLYSGQ